MSPVIEGSLEEFKVFQTQLMELTGQLLRHSEVASWTVEPEGGQEF